MRLSFFKNKKVFLTGHTGFKGSWLCRILVRAGAQLTGYALSPQGDLYAASGVETGVHSVYGDIRDAASLQTAFEQAAPEIVIHMAAQPLVRQGYQSPSYTYETNVMGTVNLLECVRVTGGVKSLLNVTTDKVYKNEEWAWGYREIDPLDGYDPYSNSKSCSELVTHSYASSFLREAGVAISTARAGNVIGGGDDAVDRIIPDCVRAALAGQAIEVRNPYATRPYQHVLEPLFAYLLILQRQWENPTLAGWYNVGPNDADCANTGRLASLFCQYWGSDATWHNTATDGPHEADFLKLDCSKIKADLDWSPAWRLEEAVEHTVAWYKARRDGKDLSALMDAQIQEYLKKAGFIENV